MSNFVWDATAVPDGKVNANPLGIAANKGITATEWNTSMQALKDLRDAIVNGKYHSLQEFEAALSALGTARTRFQDGRVQISEDGGDYRTVLQPGLNVHDFGAKGDGSTDDTAAIQAAITQAQIQGLPLRFECRTYVVSDMIKAEHGENGLQLIGIGKPNASAQTKIKMVSTVRRRAVFSLYSDASHVEGICFDANRSAKYGVFVKGSSFSTFWGCSAKNACVDSWHMPRRTDDTDVEETLGDHSAWASSTVVYVGQRRINDSGKCYEVIAAGTTAASGGPTGTSSNILDNTARWAYVTPGAATINDTNTFENCWGTNSGSYFHSSGEIVPEGSYPVLALGTVACTSGDSTIVGTGTKFTQLGLRMGDFLCIGSLVDPAAQFLEVRSVTDDTHLVVGTKKPSANLSGQEFAIGQGAGYWETNSGDNNINHVIGGLWRFNNGCGIRFGGLVGSGVTRPQIDFNAFYGQVISGPPTGIYVYTGTQTAPYFEANIVAHFLLSNAQGIHWVAPEFGAGYYVAPFLASTSYGLISGSAQTTDVLSGVSGSETTNVLVRGSVNPGDGGFTFNGEVRQYAVNAGVLSTGSTITSAAALVSMGGSGGLTFVSTPTIAAGLSGQTLRLRNDSAGSFVLQDNGTLAGSTLDLQGRTTITIPVRGTAQFSWNGSKWVLDWASPTSGTNTGDVTIGTANGLSLVGQALSLSLAVAAGSAGALSGSDKTKLDATSGTNTGDVSMAAVGAAPSANGATIASQVLTLQPADATRPGVVTAGTQSFGGAKTLLGKATLNAGAEIVGPVNAYVQAATVSAVGTTIPTSGYLGAQLNTSTDFVMTATPTFTAGAAAGQLMYVYNANDHRVTLQDDSYLTGTKLYLGRARLTLEYLGAALFYWNGTLWVLIGHANRFDRTYTDDTATTGNRTVNTIRGRNKIAAGGTSITITNDQVRANGHVDVTLGTNDSTAILKNVVVVDGSFTANIVACTADTVVDWHVTA